MNKQKLILYIGGFELPDKNAAAHRVIANSKIFLSLGYDILLMGLTKNVAETNKKFNYQGLDCINLLYPNKLFSWFSYLTTIHKYFQHLSHSKPDIIIAYNFPAIALYKLLRYGKRNNIKIVSDCTEWYQPKGNLFFRLIKGSDVNLRMKFIQPKLDGLIVISEFLKEYYKNKQEHILLLPPLVDKRDEKWEYAKIHGVYSDKIKLIYAGSPGLGMKDRLDLIIKSVIKAQEKKYIDVSLDIIGVSMEDFLRNRATKNESSLPEYIRFLGRLSHREVLCYLSGADFQIFIRENNRVNTAGFPTKFVESLSSGILVLTNYSSDLKKYLINGENGFSLDITSETTLVDSLLKVLLLSKQEISQMKEKIDSNTFDYRRYISKTDNFLNSL